jgi:hypothetical protein
VKFEVFFKNYGPQTYFTKVKGLYVKIFGLWGFTVDCYEVQGPF